MPVFQAFENQPYCFILTNTIIIILRLCNGQHILWSYQITWLLGEMNAISNKRASLLHITKKNFCTFLDPEQLESIFHIV